MKEIISVIGVILTFIAYVPYYRDILRGKTHPHVYSWGLWGLLTVLIVALQIKGGAGPSAFITIAAGLLCFGVIALGLKHSKRDITTSDTVVAILGLIAIGFWLFADQPVVSIILVTVSDFLAFIPTIRKSWNKPYSETLSLYATNAFRFGLALFALKNVTVLSALWPAFWALGNGMFAVMLFIRRQQISYLR